LERRIGLISIMVGVIWLAFCITSLILGFKIIGGIEDTIIGSVDLVRNIDILNLFEGPLMDLKNDIQSDFNTIKFMVAGVTTLFALPQILLMYIGWLLKKGTSKGLRRRRKQTTH